jgi:hypothetical protein
MPGYRTWATNDIPSANDWNELHADPLSADTAASDSSTATSYGALTTAGPSVTKTLVAGQKALVTVTGNISTISNGGGFISFEVTGASALAPIDANAAKMVPGSGVNVGGDTVQRTTVYTAGGGGSHTFTDRYKTNGNSTTFDTRRITFKSF